MKVLLIGFVIVLLCEAWQQSLPEGIERGEVSEYGCRDNCCAAVCDTYGTSGVAAVERCRAVAPWSCELWMRREYRVDAQYIDCVVRMMGTIGLNFEFVEDLRVRVIDPVKIEGIRYECGGSDVFRVVWGEASCASPGALGSTVPSGSVAYDASKLMLTMNYGMVENPALDSKRMTLIRGESVSSSGWSCQVYVENYDEFRIVMDVLEFTNGTAAERPATNPPITMTVGASGVGGLWRIGSSGWWIMVVALFTCL